MATTVAVLGGGVGGLCAAHELAERGFAVTVYEKRPGRAARRAASRTAPAPTADDLPGRARVPVLPGVLPAPAGHDGADPVGAGSVRDRLVGAERILFARADGANELLAPAHAPESLADLGRAGALRVRGRDAARRARASTSRGCWSGCSRCSPAATSVAWGSGTCESWWAYVQAAKRSRRRSAVPRRRADADARRRARDAR